MVIPAVSVSQQAGRALVTRYAFNRMSQGVILPATKGSSRSVASANAFYYVTLSDDSPSVFQSILKFLLQALLLILYIVLVVFGSIVIGIITFFCITCCCVCCIRCYTSCTEVLLFFRNPQIHLNPELIQNNH